MIPSLMQDPTFVAALLAALLPLCAFALIMVFTRNFPGLSATLSIAAVTGSLVSAIFLLVQHWGMEAPVQYAGQWLISSDIIVPAGFLLDPVSLLMLTLVALISFLVQVYSLGYMAGDPGFSRYYAYMSLFAWAMMSLAVSPSLFQLYVFWELVGLSSYLLIGFWYEKFSASEAGKKAFVMTRLGDVAFLLGLLLVLIHFGNLNILEVNGPELATRMSPALVTLSALLIFGGVVGKSAQFPLLTWLPDAMEGPTPVSALLHSATMVAAGVFLFTRLFPFFSHSATAMGICLGIGTISMLLASTMAMVSRDIKQVWAYSTISQLGFMIMGLGAGSYFAGAFHLTTHAGFKALLFLCSGVFIHFYGSNDVYEISRQGGRRLKIPTVCMVLAAAALAGLPPFSGFFSKELIMGGLADLRNPIWLAAGFLGAFLTAYYAFRVIFIILFPKTSEEANTESHHGSVSGHGTDQHHGRGYGLMAWPLIILGIMTLLLGAVQSPLEQFLTGQTAIQQAHPGNHHPWLIYVALGLAASGVGLAWVEFGRAGARQVGFVERIAPLKTLFAERWYMDRFYRHFLDYIIYRGFSALCTKNDKRFIDDGIDSLCNRTVETGQVLSYLHLGMIQYRMLVLFVVIVLLALYYFV